MFYLSLDGSQAATTSLIPYNFKIIVLYKKNKLKNHRPYV